MNACLQKSCVIMCFSSLFLLQQAFFQMLCKCTSANPNVEMHFVGVCKKLQSTLLLYYICKCFTNPVMKENSFISLGQESDCMVWIRWQKTPKTPDGRSTKAKWASPVSTDVHRCQQMPTKLSISDGHFSSISWNCLHGLSVMGGVPSVPYILPNSLIILTAKACMKLYLIVWL